MNSVVSFDNLYYLDGEDFISIPEYLINKNLAKRTHEPFASKVSRKV